MPVREHWFTYRFNFDLFHVFLTSPNLLNKQYRYYYYVLTDNLPDIRFLSVTARMLVSRR